MDKLKVLGDPFGGPPDLRGHFGPPMVVAGDGLTVAGQVDACAVLPARVEDRADPTAAVGRPPVEGEDGTPPRVPRDGRGRVLRVTRAVEAEHVGDPVLRRDADEGEGPRDVTSAHLPSAWPRRNAGFATSARKARSSGALDEPCPSPRAAVHSLVGDEVERQAAGRALREGAEVGSGEGRSCVPEICRTCSVASSSLIPNFFSAAQALDSGHGLRGGEAVVHGLAVEGNGGLDLAAAVQVCLDARGADVLADDQELVERLVTVLEKDQQVIPEAVLLDLSRPRWRRSSVGRTSRCSIPVSPSRR